MKGTVTARQLGKAYRRYASRWGRLAEWVMPWSGPRHTVNWVLQDINFTLLAGESVGIIGVNGAGKSTLLKLVSGTCEPSSGAVELNGRVAALLELGMGFHPDFTGRQNAMMAGQLIGLTAAEMREMMPGIEEFSEIGGYMDQPVRVYSSGMAMRLAFSIATCKRPDILIVDEALSVGDTYFQHKSFNRIRDFRQQGTTLLMVSHDKAAIQSICDRAILLDGGRISMEGSPESVLDYYNALLAKPDDNKIEQRTLENGRIQTVSGSGEASVSEIGLFDDSGCALDVVRVGQRVTLKAKVSVKQDIESLVLGYGIKDRLGMVIFGTNTWHSGQVIQTGRKGESYLFSIVFEANFGVGSYSIQTALVDRDTHLSRNYEWRDLALVFHVINTDKQQFTGVAWSEPSIKVEKQ